ncbi:MAG: molecular chaperone Tir [Bacteroidales bacterium]|nr:molecular chaperone Tir [Bacteroidales bacterium]
MARTKTYVAGDWDGDKNAIDQLYKWNESERYGLSFSDAHDLTQARDSSLNCSIKKSLAERLNSSKTFVLIVGNKTIDLRAGGCHFCNSYDSWYKVCERGHSVDYRSYIEYECEKAVDDGLNIIVLYNSISCAKWKCPEAVRNRGIHKPMQKTENGIRYWDYQSVKSAFDFYRN